MPTTFQKAFGIPLDELTRPRDGDCLVDRWWVVHPEDGLMFYASEKRYATPSGASPQCNGQEAITRKLRDNLYPDCDVQFVPAVYVGFRGY